MAWLKAMNDEFRVTDIGFDAGSLDAVPDVLIHW